jgi:hypothetical protein
MEITLDVEFLTQVRERKHTFTSPSDDTFTCHRFVKEKDALFGGKSDGQIIAWRQSRAAHSDLKDVAFKGHKGYVYAIIYVADFSNGLLLSSSAGKLDKIAVYFPYATILWLTIMQSL